MYFDEKKKTNRYEFDEIHLHEFGFRNMCDCYNEFATHYTSKVLVFWENFNGICECGIVVASTIQIPEIEFIHVVYCNARKIFGHRVELTIEFRSTHMLWKKPK